MKNNIIMILIFFVALMAYDAFANDGRIVNSLAPSQPVYTIQGQDGDSSRVIMQVTEWTATPGTVQVVATPLPQATVQPTYTLFPTYTAVPTYTPQATFAVFDTHGLPSYGPYTQEQVHTCHSIDWGLLPSPQRELCEMYVGG